MRAVVRSTELARRQFTTAFRDVRGRRRAMKHSPLPWAPVAAASVPKGETARECLIRLGGDARAVDEMLRKHPEVAAYDVATEIAPRMSYLSFLEARGELAGETALECSLRQPGILERKYETVFRCDERAYIAVNKPFAVRLDTPRGWMETDAEGNRVEKTRFTPRWEGDASCEDWLNGEYPNKHHRFCHQLDTATSGVVLTANSREAAGAAAKLFRERKAKKRYLAVVMGWPEEDEWTTNAKLGKDPECEKGFRERVDEEKGKASETHFKVLQRGYCSLEGENYGLKITRVECRPVTGRRHQIRVHLRHSGYPILGDQAYSPDRDSFRMYLHALELRMPFDEEELVFFTDVPQSFVDVVSVEPLA